jgi:CheY-like chemotaxis protein
MDQVNRREKGISVMMTSDRGSVVRAGAGPRPAADVEVVQTGPDRETLRRRPAPQRALRVLVADDYRDAADRLLDVAMPWMDGYELARQLRRQPALEGSRLMAVTASGDETHRRRCAEAGFDQVLVKPVEPSALEELLQHENCRLAEEPAAVSGFAGRAYGILVVDDEPCVRGVLSAVLRQRGFAVWVAADGLQAIELYWRHRPAIDVVLLDVRMPMPDGPQTLGALREIDAQVRCCFMSGELGKYSAEALYEAGATAIFTKPLPLAEVAQTLWELASRPATGPPIVDPR